MTDHETYYATPESIMTDRQMYELEKAAFERTSKELDTALAELTELASSSGSDHIAAKYWKQRQDARNELCTVKDERDAAKWERDAALQRVSELEGRLRADVDLMNIAGIDGPGAEKALAAHDAKVKADALREAAEQFALYEDAQAWLRAEADRIEKEAS